MICFIAIPIPMLEYLHRLIASKSESFESEGSDLEPEALLKARG